FSNRTLVANAKVQLGICYEKLGQSRAKEYFQEVVAKYSDQTAAVSEAKKRLNASAETQREIATPYTDDPYSFAISPDGRSIVFQASAVGGSQLWLQPLDSRVKATPIRGTESTLGSMFPFWSPDGRHIGFFANFKLKRVDLDGSNLMELDDAPSP